jgi:PTH1 family peptidyl-tRNA hydrolase
MVIVDDIALPFGKIRIRAKGSSGGHNGQISIESSIRVTNIRGYA